MSEDFVGFNKIARLTRNCTITEKIDGTNGQIKIFEDGTMLVGSRNRWITPEDDNYGFAKWCYDNKEDLLKLGVGSHFGEWWGQGIQHGYGLNEKRFSLFNTKKWGDNSIRPACCDVVPVLYEDVFDTEICDKILRNLALGGSVAAKGCMRPEGIIIYHHAANLYFKKTILKDDERKGK